MNYIKYIYFINKNVDHASCICSIGQTKYHHMVFLLLHGHQNIPATISSSWIKENFTENGILTKNYSKKKKMSN